MDEYESLSHSKWECKYHVVFIPKGRRKVLYGELRKYLGEVFRKLAEQKGKPDRGRASAPGSRAYDDFDPPEVCRGAGRRVYQGEERDSPGAGVRRAEAKFCGAEFLGARVLCVDSRSGRSRSSKLHPDAGAGGQAPRPAGHVALKRPPSGGQ
jgi:hypothetical protein